MASSVGGDLSRIETGPCKLTTNNLSLGHTLGGCQWGMKPQTRKRMVDEYGEHAVAIIGIGDETTIKTTLVEKTLAVVQSVFLLSYGMTVGLGANVVGLGRLPSDRTSLAKELRIHPLEAGESTADDVIFYRAIVSDNGEVTYGTIQDDRVFEVTWTALIDEDRDDGNLIGQIGVATS